MPIEFPGFDYFGRNPFGDDEEIITNWTENPFRPKRDPFEDNPFLQEQASTPTPAPAQKARPEFKYEEGPLMGKYRDFIQQPAPTREDFQPTKMQRFGAVLGSIGDKTGYEGTRDILDRPYNQAVLDRQLREKELKAGADVEYKAGQEAWDRYREGETLSQGQRRLDIDEANKRSLAQRRENMNTVNNWRMQNPGFDVWEHKGGFAYMRNKATGESKPILGPDGNPLPSGRFTDEERLEQEQENRIALEGERGEQARRTERVRQEGRIELNEARGMTSQQLERLRQSGRLNLEDAKIIGREQIMDFAVRHPKYTQLKVEGGNWHMVNPHDPTDSVDTGITTGTLSEDDAIVRRLGGGTTTVTSINPEGTQRTTRTTRTPGTVAPRPAQTTTPTRTTAAPAERISITRPARVTAPDGKVYPTTGWSDSDWANAEEAKFK